MAPTDIPEILSDDALIQQDIPDDGACQKVHQSAAVCKTPLWTGKICATVRKSGRIIQRVMIFHLILMIFSDFDDRGAWSGGVWWNVRLPKDLSLCGSLKGKVFTSSWRPRLCWLVVWWLAWTKVLQCQEFNPSGAYSRGIKYHMKWRIGKSCQLDGWMGLYIPMALLRRQEATVKKLLGSVYIPFFPIHGSKLSVSF